MFTRLVKLPNNFTGGYSSSFFSSAIFTYIFFNVYLFLRQRETERERGRGRERRRHRIRSGLQAPSCQHRARSGAGTHGPRDHDLSRSRPLNQLSHPGAPLYATFWIICSVLYCSSWILSSKASILFTDFIKAFFTSKSFVRLIFYLNILFLTERERERERRRGRERERGRQRIWSRLHADSREPDLWLELTNHEIMTWAKVGQFNQ